ncbi:MAG: MerR family transcriptional regulator [Pseudomonadota bacterium]
MPHDQKAWTISQLAAEFGISTRTIRFYEEKNLIAPDRTSGGHRIYRKRDRARLKLILRGKRFGHSLEEIAEMIGLAPEEKGEREQIERTLAYGDRNLKEIRLKIKELRLLERDILEIRDRLLDKLRELDQTATAD